MERSVSCRLDAWGRDSAIMASCPRIAGAGIISTPSEAMLSSSPAAAKLRLVLRLCGSWGHQQHD